MSVQKLIKSLGLHNDPDVKVRLAEIEKKQGILKDRKAKISPKMMNDFVNERNPSIQLLAMKRPEITAGHLDRLLDTYPNAEDILSSKKISSPTLERLVNKHLESKGVDSSLTEGSPKLVQLEMAIQHPNTSANVARAILPKREGELMPHDWIHYLIAKKSTPSDVLHTLVTMPRHKIGVFSYKENKFEPAPSNITNNDRLTTEGWYQNLVHHPHAAGETLQHVAKTLNSHIQTTRRSRFLVPLAVHPNSNDAVLNHIASQRNVNSDPVIGVNRFDRDYALREPSSRKDSHTMVAKHRNASDATLAKLMTHSITKYDRGRMLQTLNAISVHPNAKPKTVATAKAKIADIKKVYRPF